MKISAILPFFLSSVAAQTWKPGDFSNGAKIEYLSLPTPVPPLHAHADGGGCIPHKDGSGYFYVSNAEIGKYPTTYDSTQARKDFTTDLIGGAYAFEFNAAHELIGYQKILGNTGLNCHGGVTPWNTWISCEEHRQWGRCWQVDPHGEIEPQPTDITGSLGLADYGNWEAFAWDGEHAYVSDDDKPSDATHSFKGTIVRYTPDATAKACLSADTDAGKWCVLNSGTHDFLKVNDDNTFEWVASREEANPEMYAGSEGLDYTDGKITFVTVVDKLMFRLDLATSTYTKKSVPFPQEPDNIRMLGDTLYLCTDGDHDPNDAVWGWNADGAFKVLYEENHNYPAGVSFSPDGKMMYFSFWGEATWQFWREDGLRFDEPTAGIVYEHGVGLDD